MTDKRLAILQAFANEVAETLSEFGNGTTDAEVCGLRDRAFELSGWTKHEDNPHSGATSPQSDAIRAPADVGETRGLLRAALPIVRWLDAYLIEWRLVAEGSLVPPQWAKLLVAFDSAPPELLRLARELDDLCPDWQAKGESDAEL